MLQTSLLNISRPRRLVNSIYKVDFVENAQDENIYKVGFIICPSPSPRHERSDVRPCDFPFPFSIISGKLHVVVFVIVMVVTKLIQIMKTQKGRCSHLVQNS